jgi:RNA ligase (TIGR02306 family)
MERKLASIQKVKAILPIEGADAIEVIQINNWKVVAKKGEFNEGDLVVYCEIDSFLPIRDEFEFLRKSSYKKMGDVEGFRLKTIKLRGQVSQGLVLPKTILISLVDAIWEGLDVTKELGILKYDPPIPAELSGVAKGNFPSFIKKTDEERIQYLSNEYGEMKVFNYYITEKLDGSSATFYFKDGQFGVCSRNLELLESENNTFWKVAREMKLENKMASTRRNLCFQGELIGEGIQGNPYEIKGQTVKFFNGFDIDTQEYFDRLELQKYMSLLELEMVPVLDIDYRLPDTIEEIIKKADGKSMLNLKTDREGLVIRSHDRRISFKAISNRFLLNEK